MYLIRSHWNSDKFYLKIVHECSCNVYTKTNLYIMKQKTYLIHFLLLNLLSCYKEKKPLFVKRKNLYKLWKHNPSLPPSCWLPRESCLQMFYTFLWPVLLSFLDLIHDYGLLFSISQDQCTVNIHTFFFIILFFYLYDAIFDALDLSKYTHSQDDNVCVLLKQSCWWYVLFSRVKITFFISHKTIYILQLPDKHYGQSVWIFYICLLKRK
jgi:hypothetical protein